jgi:hypothetical protein
VYLLPRLQTWEVDNVYSSTPSDTRAALQRIGEMAVG